jgi:hypothetical protein
VALVLPSAVSAGVDDDFPPAAHWALDDASGTDVTDSGAGGHDGVASGTEWITGRNGGALRFTGGDQVLFPTDPADLPTSTITVAMWVRSSIATGDERIILNAGAAGCSSSYRVFAHGPGIAMNGFYLATQPDGDPIWDGEWHHVMFQLDQSQQTMWLDGVRMGRAFIGVSLGSPLADATVSLGKHQSCGTTLPFVGDVDDIRIYVDGPAPAPELIAPELLDDPISTTTTIERSPATVYEGTAVKVDVAVDPSPGGGEVALERWDGATWQPLRQRDLTTSGTAELWVYPTDLPMGASTIRARFMAAGRYEASTSGEVTVTRTKVPTVTTLAVTPAINYPTGATTLTASVDRCPGAGTVKFFRLQNGSSLQIGIDELDVCTATATVSTLPIGTFQVYAIYYGTADYAVSTSAPRTHRVAKIPTSATLTKYTNTIRQHDVALLDVAMKTHPHANVPGPIPAPTGSWTYKRTTDGVTSIMGYRPGGLTASMSTAALPVGTHDITATYSSDAIYAATTTNTLRVVVLPDIAQASGFATSTSTFYPVVDGYRDTVGITGRLEEPATVEITVRNANGTLVRTLAVSRRTGTYSQGWDGKNSSGTLLAAGTYAIRQVVKDDYGNTLTWNGSVVLSRKKLVEKTGSKTRYANDYQAVGRSGTTTLAKSPIYANGLRIQTRSVGGYVALGYEFTLPSATVYSKLQLRVYGRGGTAEFGLQDMTLPGWDPGDDWIIDAFSPIVSTSSSERWNSLTGDVNRHRDGRMVRAMVKSTTQIYDVYKVQLLYTYKVLE